jgi:hypothetical protein
VDKDEALKKALEAYKYWGGKPLPTLELQAINAIKEALAHPETEPVAIRLSNGVIDVLGGALVPIGTLLYTTSPKREWVGLDDEDMKELRDANFDLLYGARWAERKLREKNGG